MTLRIATPKELVRNRRDARRLLVRMIELDYRDIHGLTAEDEGNLRQWVDVFMKSPDTYRVLIDNRKRICGYWHFMALGEKAFALARSGKLPESRMTKDVVCSLRRAGHYKMYFTVTVLLPKFRDTGAIKMLDDAFYDAMESFASRGVYFTERCTNAYTKDGLKRMREEGMRFIAPAETRGRMYSMDFYEFLKRNAKGRRELLDLYKLEFGRA